MEFGVLGLEGLVSANCSAAHGSSDPSADAEAKGIGSGFRNQQRSGSEEDDWRALKMAKTEDFSSSKTVTLHRSNEAPSRSNVPDHHNRPQEHMLSFSLNKSEPPYYQSVPSSYSRNAAAGSLVSSNMHGHFAGIRGPFTPSQWNELQQHALIYKYITANVPVPSNLLIPIKRSFHAYGLSYASNSFGWGCFHLGFSDPELGRCRRTDGKKWRCSRDAVADQKYCERHINRGRHRSRKPVEACGTTNSKVVPPMSSSLSTSVKLSLGGASNGIVIQQNHVQPSGSAISPWEALVNRMGESHSTFPVLKQDGTFPELTPLEFGFVSSDSLLNPSQSSSFQESQDQHPLGQFMEDWPKDRSDITLPEELKPDWTQLSMSDFSSSSTQEKLELSPLRLSHEVNDPTQKHTNWRKSSMGGPLGEVLTNRSKHLAPPESYRGWPLGHSQIAVREAAPELIS